MDKKWINLSNNIKEINNVTEISNELGISPILSQVVLNRNIQNIQEAKRYLFPNYSHLHNPFLLKDMEKAIERIIKALRKNQKIVIYGDYDVDGVTSTILLMIFFRETNADIDFFIPLRFDGYGLNKDAIKNIKEEYNADLIITVDCGITAVEEVKYAKELGMDIIITDHHDAPDLLPDAFAIINPKRKDSEYPFKEIAGVGVAYKLATALQSKLNIPQFSNDVRELLDIVAFGTVADVMPITNENRIIVKYGLEILNDKENVRRGFKQLQEVSGLLDKNITAGHIGFQLAPRINALGRLRNVREAVEMFLVNNDEESLKIAKELDAENTQRKKIQEEIYKDVMSRLPEPEEFEDYVIVLGDKKWHTGIKGIVASNVLEKFHKPVILFAITEEGIAEGSARSIETLDIYNALKECSDVLLKYGGHEQAAGMKLKEEDLDKFREKINNVAKEKLTKDDLIPIIKYDSEISISDITFDLVEQISYLEPYGMGNPSPTFQLKNTMVLEAKGVGSENKHLKVKIQEGGHIIDGIGFGLGHLEKEITNKDNLINMVCALSINEWNGKQTLQVDIKDIKITKKEVDPLLERMENLFKEADQYLESSNYHNIEFQDNFSTKVVGISFENRQDIAKTLNEGDEVFLQRDINYPNFPHAIKVITRDNEQIGFLKDKLAQKLSKVIDGGVNYKATISNITGNDKDKENIGVNLYVEKIKKQDNTNNILPNSSVKEKLSKLNPQELFKEIKVKILGNYDYRPKQLEAITHLLNNNNTTIIMGTGRGKSAIFQSIASFKSIKENKMSIIVYPLRALVNDQLIGMQKRLSQLGLNIRKGTGDISFTEKETLWEEIRNNNIDILLTTPEFLYYYKNRFEQYKDNIGHIIVDEGHHIGQATDTYRPAYKKMNEILELLGNPLCSVLTATCDDQTFTTITNSVPISKLVIDPNVRTNLTLIDKRNIRKKEEYIQEVIKAGDKTIVYVNSREKTVEIAKKLKSKLPIMKDKIGYYHAGLTSSDRLYIESLFRDGKLTTIVSTSAFGEGIDIPDIRHVIHYHMTFNNVEFNQESGRAGRDGEKAYIHLLFGDLDARINDFIMSKTAPSRDILIKIYAYLQRETNSGEQKIELDLDQLEYFFRNVYPDEKISNETIYTALHIFKELNLIELNEGSDIYFINLIPTKEKIELTNSIRYQEGLREEEDYNQFKNWVLKTDSLTLLRSINRPIYPTKTI